MQASPYTRRQVSHRRFLLRACPSRSILVCLSPADGWIYAFLSCDSMFSRDEPALLKPFVGGLNFVVLIDRSDFLHVLTRAVKNA